MPKIKELKFLIFMTIIFEHPELVEE